MKEPDLPGLITLYMLGSIRCVPQSYNEQSSRIDVFERGNSRLNDGKEHHHAT